MEQARIPMLDTYLPELELLSVVVTWIRLVPMGTSFVTKQILQESLSRAFFLPYLTFLLILLLALHHMYPLTSSLYTDLDDQVLLASSGKCAGRSLGLVNKICSFFIAKSCVTTCIPNFKATQ